jgi:hypothetical protein
VQLLWTGVVLSVQLGRRYSRGSRTQGTTKMLLSNYKGNNKSLKKEETKNQRRKKKKH